jgi:hypothetical protein
MSSLEKHGPSRDHFPYNINEVLRKTYEHVGGQEINLDAPTMFGYKLKGRVSLMIPVISVISPEGEQRIVRVLETNVLISLN